MAVNIQMHKIHQSIGLIHKNLECSVCLEMLQDPVSTKCGHQFCRFCILAVLQTKPTAPCPLCKKAITKRGLTENKRLKEIVAAVGLVTTAIEEDSGTKCSPPRGAVILSQCSQPTPSPAQPRQNQKKSSKKHKSNTRKANLRKSTQKSTSSMEIFIDGDDIDDNIQIQEPSRSNINISNSFPTPSNAKNYQKDHEKESSLLAALKKAPLRPTSKEMTEGVLDPYEFIPSQRTPKKKAKRKGVRKALKLRVNANKQLPPKRVAIQVEESRQEKMKTVDDIDVHLNGNNELEDDWNGKEVELKTVNKTKKQGGILSDNGLHEFDHIDSEHIAEQCLDVQYQIVDAQSHTIERDRTDVNEDVIDESEHSCFNKEKESTCAIDSVVNKVQFEDHVLQKKSANHDEGREECEDSHLAQKIINKEVGMLFQKIYPSKHCRKTELPQNQRGGSTPDIPVINGTDVEQVNSCSSSGNENLLKPQDLATKSITIKDNDIEKLSRRKKMQKSLRQFGTSEEDALKTTRKIATRKNDKSDWEVAMELAQEFGTLPKELGNKRHSSRQVKSKVDIRGAAINITEQSKPKKSRGRRPMLPQENSVTNENQIQEFSDSCVEGKSYSLRNSGNNKPHSATTDSEHITKCEDRRQTRSIKAMLETDGNVSAIPPLKLIKASPRAQGQPLPNIVPETPLLPREEETAKLEVSSLMQNISGENQAKDLHPEDVYLSVNSEVIADDDGEQVMGHFSVQSNAKIHENKELRRSNRQYLSKSQKHNDLCTSECTKDRSSGQRRSNRIISNTDLSNEVDDISKNSVDQSTNLKNSPNSNKRNTSTAAIPNQQSNSQLKEKLRKGFQKGALCNSDKLTSSTGLLRQQDTNISTSNEEDVQQKVISKEAGVAEDDKENMFGIDRIAVEQEKLCVDQNLETCIEGDTTDSIELSVSDIEYEEPSIAIAKIKDTPCMNTDESNQKAKQKGKREDGLNHKSVDTPVAFDTGLPDRNKDTTRRSAENLQTFLENDSDLKDNSIRKNFTHKKNQNSDELKQFLNKNESMANISDKPELSSKNQEPPKQPRRSKRKTFALGNTPEKEHCQAIEVTTKQQFSKVQEDVQSTEKMQQNGSIRYKSPESELFSDVVNANLICGNPTAQKDYNNATSNKDDMAKYSKECVTPLGTPTSSLEFNTNSDLFSDADQLSYSISSRRKSRGLSSRQGSQSIRRSPRISRNCFNSSTGTSQNRTRTGTAKKECSLNIKRSQRSSSNNINTVSIDNNTITPQKLSSSQKDCTQISKAGSQLPQATSETQNHSDASSACSYAIPATKGASQSVDKLTPPIIDYRPVMKRKRLALKVKKSNNVSDSVNCELTVTANGTQDSLKEEEKNQLKEHSSAKNCTLQLNSDGNKNIESAHSNSSDICKDVYGDDEAEVNVSEVEVKEHIRDKDLDFKCEISTQNTTHVQESQGNNEMLTHVGGCSDIDDDDEDNIIPPTPILYQKSSESIANSTSELATRFSKKSVGNPTTLNIETALDNTERETIISPNKDGSICFESSNSGMSTGSQHLSLSVFHDVLNVQKVQLISPLGSTPLRVPTKSEGLTRESHNVIHKDSQEVELPDSQQQLIGESIENETIVDNPMQEVLTSQDCLVDDILESDDENCSDDNCSPNHNGNSASSLLSSQAEILNTQECETAKQEMEKIAQEIKELEAAMKDGKSGLKSNEEADKKSIKMDETFNPECFSDTEDGIEEIEISDEEVDVNSLKTAKQRLGVAPGRSRILRPAIDSDTDEDDQLGELRDVGRNKKSNVNSFVKVLGDTNEINGNKTDGWTSTPPSSNTCLKSPSILHSPRSPSPPPPVCANELLKESPQELKEKLSSINTIMQEYKKSGQKRKRTILGDVCGQHDTTPKRHRVDGTEQSNTAYCSNVGLPIEHAPVKVERNYSFVATGLSRSELKEVEQLAQKSGIPFASTFNNNTTHVIVKTDANLVCERTLKYFLGIAGKKWVISFKWVRDCLQAGYLLPEEKYEVVGDVASGNDHQGPKRSRMQKTSLLQDYDVCCVGEFTMLTKGQLTQLLELTGVTKVSHPTMFPFYQNRKAIIIAQPDADQEPINFQGLFRKFKVPVISREWILDSIAPSTVQALDDYLLCDVPEQILEKY
ncbi:uncharacterized protein LOC117112136 isoform X2 [Anneissia japonica]|uniref:uncharacterized protein LOC117112136 isoform X2 n=1 Tax=Anneissia japonica TaxID=1529436 RepID=UPI001425550D|nr:uncharacterized protein LOC117112136 isoform X2 [Anneissia japonica]